MPVRLHRRLDLKLVPLESYPCATLHFTGSVLQRASSARPQRTPLNEYSIRRLDDAGEVVEPPLDVRSEEDIFRIIGMDFVPPERRS